MCKVVLSLEAYQHAILFEPYTVAVGVCQLVAVRGIGCEAL
jgi:hypothetical protein